MNRSKIEWCTHTDNIMTGCRHGCPYCYARKQAESPFYAKAFPYGFEPHFHENRIGDMAKLKRPAIIFQGSMTDIFGDWWKPSEIEAVMQSVRAARQHKIVILTKNPLRLANYLGGSIHHRVKDYDHVYFGTSVTGGHPMEEIPRLQWLRALSRNYYNTIISFEPLLGDPNQLIRESGGINWADWIIIGGQTKPKRTPDMDWLNTIFLQCDSRHGNIPIFCKNNLGEYWQDKKVIQEFPRGLLPIAKAWGKA